MLQSATLQNPEGVKHLQIKEKQQDSDKITNTKKKQTDFSALHEPSHADSERKESERFSPSSPPNITVTASGEFKMHKQRYLQTDQHLTYDRLCWWNIQEWKKKFRKSRVESLEMRLERWTSPGIDKRRLVWGLETNLSLPLSSVPFPGDFKHLLLLQC